MIPNNCAKCPLAVRRIESDRYVCNAEHNFYNPVVRGHWMPTTDCKDVIITLKKNESLSTLAI